MVKHVKKFVFPGVVGAWRVAFGPLATDIQLLRRVADDVDERNLSLCSGIGLAYCAYGDGACTPCGQNKMTGHSLKK